ncbi:MAG: restriction endonuclease [Bacteroidales bacterium]|nr:restriction endonuclease [Bacteroidales bacterium]
MSNKKFKIIKASGEEQDFSEEKLRNSLHRSGAPQALVDAIVTEVYSYMRDGITTRQIYDMAFQILRKRVRSNAARYSLKRAIMELGPTGFPFERLVAEVFIKQGYAVEVSKTIRGKCVRHEVDVVAQKDNVIVMVECKYHNTQGKICNVHVPLYIRSRFNDIESVWRSDQRNENIDFEGWVVTNTRFSGDAEEYGICAGLKLVGWDFPHKDSLKEMIEKAGLLPITVITGLAAKQKQILLEAGVLLCSELCQKPHLLDLLHLDPRKQDKVMEEVHDLCLL